MGRYMVVGECATVTVPAADGPRGVMVFKGSPLPDGVSRAQLKHLLSVKLIRALDEPDPEPAVEAAGSGGTTVESDAADDDGDDEPDVDDDRSAAQAKLPSDGGPPATNAAKAVWVEYLVRRGFDYEAALGSSKSELVALAKGLSS